MLAALLLLGAAACGDGDDLAAPNACDVLTTEEATELLGVPTTGGSEDTDRSSGTYCEWVSTDTDDGGDASDAGSDSDIESYFLSVEIDQGESAVQGFASGKSEEGDADDGEGPAYEPVDGLGDDAYFDVAGGLEVRRGDIVFSTYTRSTDEHPLTREQRRDIERGAAELVVERVGDPSGDTDIESATECGETGRCLGSRYRACDLFEDAEIEEITGFVVSDVDGQIERGGSENGGICDYTLEDPEPVTSSRNHGVEVYIEPDRDAAEEQYREARRSAERDESLEEVPELGSDAFYSPLFQTVYVLEDGKLLEISFESELPDFTADTSPAIVQTNIDLAALALERL
jgi:hypothetical protein